VVSRIDSVDTHTINGITLELQRLAGEYCARYDGWECPVMRSAERTEISADRAQAVFANHHDEVVSRQPHNTLSCEAVTLGNACHLGDVPQTPFGVAPLE
jgi:hypothetical protein